jgi:large subunit ribosomal protein L4
MAQLDIINKKSEVVGKIKLAAWWGDEVKGPVVHQAVVAANAGARRGTASVKNRSDVRGGGRKPFRQKGTGRARQGTSRSAQIRGGGVVFGPHPRDFSKKMNKKMSRKALQNGLAGKAAAGSLLVLDSIEMEEPRTRQLVEIMDSLDVVTALLVVDEVTENLERASSNLGWVKVVTPDAVNIYDVLAHEKLILTKSALETLEGALTK